MKFASGVLLVLAVSLCMSSVSGFTARVIGAEPLRVRAAPNTHSTVLSLLGSNANFDVDCQIGGDVIASPTGKTGVWYHVPSRGGYVSAAWAASNGQSAPGCGGPAKVNTGGTTLNIRSAPSSHSAAVGSLASNAELNIDCQTTGESNAGLSGNTNVWYHVASRGFVSGAWVSTGGRSFPGCGATPAPTPSGGDCSAGLRNPRTCSEAVAWAEAHISTSFNSDYRRKCDHVVGLAYGRSASGFDSAIIHWNTTPERFRHYDRSPPPGALVFFRSGEFGHACLSTGGGNLISTDINGPGTLTRTSIAGIESKWGSPYLGWTNPYFHNA